MEPDLYRRRMEMLRMVFRGADPSQVMDSLAMKEVDGKRVVDERYRQTLRTDWGRRQGWIPEIVRASSRDMLTFQSEMIGIVREARGMLFDIATDSQGVKPKERVMALNSILSSVQREAEILKFVKPTSESVDEETVSLEGKRASLSLILKDLETSNPDLAFTVAKVLSGSDLASLPSLDAMR